jgi:transcriptional regulator with XRE-family HTH domain
MTLSKKLKLLRSYKGWTQEKMAEKLGISTYAYAKIERCETNVSHNRLKQISEVGEIDLEQLFGLDITSIFNLYEIPNNNNNNSHHTQCDILNLHSNNQTELQHELEKAQLMIEQRDKEIELLRQQMSDLREMNQLLKQSAKLKDS